jgi:hypothetical protein
MPKSQHERLPADVRRDSLELSDKMADLYFSLDRLLKWRCLPSNGRVMNREFVRI